MGDYDPFSDAELKSAFIELMKSMEDKISSACEQSGKAGKTAKNTPQKNNAEKMEGRLMDSLENLYPMFMAFVCSLDYQPGEKKLLPVQMDKFADADLARVDELLIKIIRQRAHRKNLELQVKSARQDLESLEGFNQAIADQTLNKDVFTSFQHASKLYQNILTSQNEMEEQGLADQLNNHQNPNSNIQDLFASDL